MIQPMKTIRTQIDRRRVRLALAGLGAGAFLSVLVWSGVEAFQRQAEPVALAATQSSVERPVLGARPPATRLPQTPRSSRPSPSNAR